MTVDHIRRDFAAARFEGGRWKAGRFNNLSAMFTSGQTLHLFPGLIPTFHAKLYLRASGGRQWPPDYSRADPHCELPVLMLLSEWFCRGRRATSDVAGSNQQQGDPGQQIQLDGRRNADGDQVIGDHPLAAHHIDLAIR
jgi:hypothetical protein